MQVRLTRFHVAAAALAALTVGCSGDDPSAADTQSSEPSLSCAQYCSAIGGTCTGDAAQYPSESACLEWCGSAAWPVGSTTQQSESTLGCRLHFATEPATPESCAAAGPLSPACGQPCDVYCEGALALCSDASSPLYVSKASCLGACALFPAGVESSTGDSLGCRLTALESVLTSGATAKAACQAAAPDGGGVCTAPPPKNETCETAVVIGACDVSGPQCVEGAGECGCAGCVIDGECAITDDCVCADCAGQSFCDGADCDQDGICDPYNEDCSCKDCAFAPGRGGCEGSCAGKECGDDGCGKSCGSCGSHEVCSEDQRCAAPETQIGNTCENPFTFTGTSVSASAVGATDDANLETFSCPGPLSLATSGLPDHWYVLPVEPGKTYKLYNFALQGAVAVFTGSCDYDFPVDRLVGVVPPVCDSPVNSLTIARAQPEAKLEAQLSECLKACASAGAAAAAACGRSCMATGLGLDQSCGECWGGVVGCVLDDCASACTDPTATACLQCGEAQCGAAYQACSGLPLVLAHPPIGCAPQCDGKACGDDGCGGTCGACPSGALCQDGSCYSTYDCDLFVEAGLNCIGGLDASLIALACPVSPECTSAMVAYYVTRGCGASECGQRTGLRGALCGEPACAAVVSSGLGLIDLCADDPAACPGAAGGCPSAIMNVEEGLNVAPLTTLHLNSSSSYDAAGVGSRRWSVTQPPGSASSFFPSDTHPSPTFQVTVAGEYTFELRIWDVNGVESCVSSRATVTVVSNRAIHVELLWHTPNDADESDEGFGAGADMDLHFVHDAYAHTGPDLDQDGQPDPWFNQPYDCFWFNAYPSWGSFDPGIADDPTLDRDDTDGAGPENVSLTTPENALYRIGVHYADDHDFGDSYATLRVYIYGTLAFEAKDVLMHEGDLWDAATIEWPSSKVTGVQAPGVQGKSGCNILTRITPSYPTGL